jgi:hypothetical protein
MKHVTAVISMLHEGPHSNSAHRLFRSEPVLSWTLQRLRINQQIASLAIICWDDQVEQVTPLAAERDAHILAKSPRVVLPNVEAVSAARRWSDGWRGGLMLSCDFDLGFHAAYVKEVIDRLSSDAVLLVDPASGMVDPKLLDCLIEHARARDALELCFTQAAPGLAGALLRPALVERLAAAATHPGRLLHYLPDQPMRDPISGEGCVPVPAPVARTTRSFRLNSERQARRLTDAAIDLNGQLLTSDAEDLLHRLRWTADVDDMPRELVLELNTARSTQPLYRPRADRPAMPLALFKRIVEQVGGVDDLRLTLGGVGDPLLHEDLFELLELARGAGAGAVHVETDLLPSRENSVDQLADSGIDVVSVHLPAMAQGTYQQIMGVDRFMQVIDNIKRFVLRRQRRRSGVPILAPTFVKCRHNLAEMEVWYDQWLKALGTAVIVGPSDFGGLIADIGVADMSPPQRKACARLWSRMTILSNGRVVTCEQDAAGRQVVGDAATQPLSEIWKRGLGAPRDSHHKGCFSSLSVCAACREWHRP